MILSNWKIEREAMPAEAGLRFERSGPYASTVIFIGNPQAKMLQLFQLLSVYRYGLGPVRDSPSYPILID